MSKSPIETALGEEGKRPFWKTRLGLVAALVLLGVGIYLEEFIRKRASRDAERIEHQDPPPPPATSEWVWKRDLEAMRRGQDWQGLLNRIVDLENRGELATTDAHIQVFVMEARADALTGLGRFEDGRYYLREAIKLQNAPGLQVSAPQSIKLIYNYGAEIHVLIETVNKGDLPPMVAVAKANALATGLMAELESLTTETPNELAFVGEVGTGIPPEGWAYWRVRGQGSFTTSREDSSLAVRFHEDDSGEALWRPTSRSLGSRLPISWEWQGASEGTLEPKRDGYFACQLVAVLSDRTALHYTWSIGDPDEKQFRDETGTDGVIGVRAVYNIMERDDGSNGSWRSGRADLRVDYDRACRELLNKKPGGDVRVLLLGVQCLSQHPGAPITGAIRRIRLGS